MDIKIPKIIEYIIDKLNQNGYEAYIVGGCVRDSIIGREPNDWDVTTSALPDDIKEVFKTEKTIEVGKKFGTITVIKESTPVEITTFRTEGEYIDGRRPDWIEFEKDIDKDLSRRDFTINAIAYNNDAGLIDPFGGLIDIENRLIKSVNNPYKRFSEDGLRIIRAIRFANQLEFSIEENTYESIIELKDKLKNISTERITAELFKILLSPKPSIGLNLLLDTGILDYILPEIVDSVDFDQSNPHHDKDVFNHILCVVDNSPKDLVIRISALFHDIAKPATFTLDDEGIGHFYGHNKVGKEMAEKILRRLKAPKKIIKSVKALVKEHMIYHNDIGNKGLKRLINRVGEEDIFKLFSLQRADILCSKATEDIKKIDSLETRVKEILQKDEALSINKLKINGNSLIQMGIPQGKLIGDILNNLLDIVMENPDLNNEEKLKEIVREKYIDKEKLN